MTLDFERQTVANPEADRLQKSPPEDEFQSDEGEEANLHHTERSQPMILSWFFLITGAIGHQGKLTSIKDSPSLPGYLGAQRSPRSRSLPVASVAKLQVVLPPAKPTRILVRYTGVEELDFAPPVRTKLTAWQPHFRGLPRNR